MASKMVVQQQKSATLVSAAAEAHAEAAALAAEALLAPHLKEGEKMPDVALLLVLGGRLLGATTQQLVAADDAHERELADDAAPRERRDEAAQHIYDRLVDLRAALTGLYGPKTAEAAGLVSATPRDPVLLARFARGVVEALPGLKFPGARIKGARLDLSEVTAELSTQLDALEASLKDVAREAREAEQTLGAKTAAAGAQARHQSGVASLLSGVFRLAGLDDLAERVRPTARRAAQDDSEPTTPETPPKP